MRITLDPASFERYRTEHMLPLVDAFEKSVAATTHVKKALGKAWFTSLRQAVAAMKTDGDDLSTHPLFVWVQRHYLGQFESDPVEMIERRFAAVLKVTSKTRALSKKLKDLGRTFNDYAPALYEILVVGRFAERGLLVDCEPALGTTGRSMDAHLRVCGADVFAEVTYRLPGPVVLGPRFVTFDFLMREAKGVRAKASDKVEHQLAFAGKPALLVVGIDDMWQDNVDPAFASVAAEADADVISAMALTTMWSEWSEVRALPRAKFPLTPNQLAELQQCFKGVF